MSESKATTRSRTRVKQEASGKVPPAISPGDYAKFIAQIELSAIWLQAVKVENQHGPQTPDQATLHFDSNARWEAQETGFRIFHTHTVSIRSIDAQLAKIALTFGLDFHSQTSMTDTIFAIFEEVNLPVNTWPFLREFVSTTIGRMGWMPFTIPALKQGVVGASKRVTATQRRRRPRAQNDE